jgi:hypothetical protein
MKKGQQKPKLILSPEQREKFVSLVEQIHFDIETGVKAFVRVAASLQTIREEKLYREDYDNFDQFCREAFHFSKTYANDLIRAREVVLALLAQGITILPDSARVANELAKFPDMRDWKMIWQKALQIRNRGKVTYKTIREAALQIVPKKATQMVWFSTLMERLYKAKAALNMSPDFSTLDSDQTKRAGKVLRDIAHRSKEFLILAENRMAQILREEEKAKEGWF